MSSAVSAVHERTIGAIAFHETITAAQEMAHSPLQAVAEAREASAFRQVVPRAQMAYVGAGLLGAMRYTDSGGKATYTRNHFKVKPTTQDFVIDVQNIARRVLTESDYRYFKRTYFEYNPMYDSAGRLVGAGLGIAEKSDASDWTKDGKDRFFEEFVSQYDRAYHDEIRAQDERVRATLGHAFAFGIGEDSSKDKYRLFPIRAYQSANDVRMAHDTQIN